MRKNLIVLFCTAWACIYAQYDAMFTQYMFNEMFINPAYAGSKEAMNATLLHRQQWVSFPGRPVTTSFSLHGPLQDDKMGLGLSVLSEKIGVLNRSLIYGSYAYRLPLAKGKLAMGLMGGLETQNNRLSTLRVNSDISAPADPQFAQNDWSMNQLAFQYAFRMGDFGASAALSTLLVGASIVIALVIVFATKFYKID